MGSAEAFSAWFLLLLLPSPGLLPLKMLFTARTPHSKHPATDPDLAHFPGNPDHDTQLPPLPTMWVFFQPCPCSRDEAWRHGDKITATESHGEWPPSHPPGGLKEMVQVGGMSTWRGDWTQVPWSPQWADWTAARPSQIHTRH